MTPVIAGGPTAPTHRGTVMADVFISYARPTASQAQRIEQAFQRMGYDVWRDSELPAHQAYSDVIEARLRGCRAVVVLWSADAARSHWVRAEADLARTLGSLVQIRLDDTPLPLPFNQIHSVDLRGWSGRSDDPAWRKVVESVAALVESGSDTYEAAGRVGATAPEPERLLAVLPFDNLSNDEEMVYFSDGVSEEILQAVVKMPDLKVVARSSSFQFRGPSKALVNVTSHLQTTHVLDGSVRRSGNRVRIAANLVECRTQTTLWYETFDRELSDVFALQDEIAHAVAQSLELVFSPGAARRKVDPVAYDLFLKARSLAGAWATNEKCNQLLEDAVARSPDLAEAWAMLAMIRALDARQGRGAAGFEATRAAALDAADRALSADPSLGLCFVARSLLEPSGAYVAREALLEQAMELSPSDPEVLKQASDFKGSVGRTRESFRLVARAHGLDPLNPVTASRHAGALAEVGLVTEAYEAGEVGRARWPDFEWFIASPLLISASRGDWEVAKPLMELAKTKGSRSLDVIGALAADFHDPTPAAQARMLTRVREQVDRSGEIQLGQIVFLHRIGLGDEAFELVRTIGFDRIFTPQGFPPDGLLLTGIIFGPLAGEMRRDPRFVDLCGALGICHYWVETDRWPDCETEVAPHYDLRAQARQYVSASRTVAPQGDAASERVTVPS